MLVSYSIICSELLFCELVVCIYTAAHVLTSRITKGNVCFLTASAQVCIVHVGSCERERISQI